MGPRAWSLPPWNRLAGWLDGGVVGSDGGDEGLDALDAGGWQHLAAEADDDGSSYPAFVRTAEDIEVRVELLMAELTQEARDERRAHVRR